MKIAVPVEDRGEDPTVAGIFGRAPLFLIYDRETGLTQIIENSAAQQAGGAGIRAAQGVLDSGASVLLTTQCGGNAEKVLLSGGVGVYKADIDMGAIENVHAFLEGKLGKLADIHEGNHRH